MKDASSLWVVGGPWPYGRNGPKSTNLTEAGKEGRKDLG